MLIIDSFSLLYNKLPNQIKTIHNFSSYSKITYKNQTARFYSTSSDSALIENLPPFFITGLTDAECSFSCIIKKNAAYKTGWRVEVVFQIGLHKKDLELLKLIQAFFGGIGVISTSPNSMCAFKVTTLKQILNQIIPHFDKYNLITQKQADYILFKQIVILIEQGKHLNKEGLQ